jgi:hypothetical protein
MLIKKCSTIYDKFKTKLDKLQLYDKSENVLKKLYSNWIEDNIKTYNQTKTSYELSMYKSSGYWKKFLLAVRFSGVKLYKIFGCEQIVVQIIHVECTDI